MKKQTLEINFYYYVLPLIFPAILIAISIFHFNYHLTDVALIISAVLLGVTSSILLKWSALKKCVKDISNEKTDDMIWKVEKYSDEYHLDSAGAREVLEAYRSYVCVLYSKEESFLDTSYLKYISMHGATDDFFFRTLHDYIKEYIAKNSHELFSFDQEDKIYKKTILCDCVHAIWLATENYFSQSDSPCRVFVNIEYIKKFLDNATFVKDKYGNFLTEKDKEKYDEIHTKWNARQDNL